MQAYRKDTIESPNAGIREKTGRVTRWRDGQMVLRWTASALVTLEKRVLPASLKNL